MRFAGVSAFVPARSKHQRRHTAAPRAACPAEKHVHARHCADGVPVPAHRALPSSDCRGRGQAPAARARRPPVWQHRQHVTAPHPRDDQAHGRPGRLERRHSPRTHLQGAPLRPRLPRHGWHARALRRQREGRPCRRLSFPARPQVQVQVHTAQGQGGRGSGGCGGGSPWGRCAGVVCAVPVPPAGERGGGRRTRRARRTRPARGRRREHGTRRPQRHPGVVRHPPALHRSPPPCVAWRRSHSAGHGVEGGGRHRPRRHCQRSRNTHSPAPRPAVAAPLSLRSTQAHARACTSLCHAEPRHVH